MHLFDITLPTPAENLALDEALLEAAESGEGPPECLRLWESPQPLVVLGRSSRRQEEVRLAECRRRQIPVLRRSSGGAAVLAGPGCLMYAVVLSYDLRPSLHMLDEAHRQILAVNLAALRSKIEGVHQAGTSDLALSGLKFSGNSLRCKQTHLLYHGTLLYDFPLELIGECLAMPPRQPDYRAGRAHHAFLTNLPLSASALREALIAGWGADAPSSCWPRDRTQTLAAERYSQPSWNERL